MYLGSIYVMSYNGRTRQCVNLWLNHILLRHPFLYYTACTVVTGEGNKNKWAECSSCLIARNMNRYYFCRRPHISGYSAPGVCWLGVLDWRWRVFLPGFGSAETFGLTKSSDNISLILWLSVTRPDSLRGGLLKRFSEREKMSSLTVSQMGYIHCGQIYMKFET